MYRDDGPTGKYFIRIVIPRSVNVYNIIYTRLIDVDRTRSHILPAHRLY